MSKAANNQTTTPTANQATDQAADEGAADAGAAATPSDIPAIPEGPGTRILKLDEISRARLVGFINASPRATGKIPYAYHTVGRVPPSLVVTSESDNYQNLVATSGNAFAHASQVTATGSLAGRIVKGGQTFYLWIVGTESDSLVF